MEYIEYLELNNNGTIAVNVKIPKRNGFRRSVADIRISPDVLLNFFDKESGELLNVMTFDDHPLNIVRIELKTDENKMIIHTKDLLD